MKPGTTTWSTPACGSTPGTSSSRLKFDDIGLYQAIREVKQGSLVCQACNLDNRNTTGKPKQTPIPDQPMESVAVDIFSMPKVHIGKEVFDFVVLCVD